jgi:hypothetical protein
MIGFGVLSLITGLYRSITNRLVAKRLEVAPLHKKVFIQIFITAVLAILTTPPSLGT